MIPKVMILLFKGLIMKRSEKIEEELKNMEIHDHCYYKFNDQEIIILRVVGGWIYSYIGVGTNGESHSVFVPYIQNGVAM
jgi:hypothetical protein